MIIQPIQEVDTHAFLPHTLKVLKTIYTTSLYSQAHCQARGMWRIFYLQGYPWRSSGGLEWLAIASVESPWELRTNTVQTGGWQLHQAKSFNPLLENRGSWKAEAKHPDCECSCHVNFLSPLDAWMMEMTQIPISKLQADSNRGQMDPRGIRELTWVHSQSGPWITQVWLVQVHLYTDFFRSKYCRTTWSVVG